MDINTLLGSNRLYKGQCLFGNYFIGYSREISWKHSLGLHICIVREGRMPWTETGTTLYYAQLGLQAKDGVIKYNNDHNQDLVQTRDTPK